MRGGGRMVWMEESAGGLLGGVRHHCSELDMQVGGEPQRGPQLPQQVHEWRTAHVLCVHLLAEVGFLPEQRGLVSIVPHRGGPIVREEDVHRPAEHGQAEHFELALVVYAAQGGGRVWRPLEVPHAIVFLVEDTRYARDANTPKPNHSTEA